MGALTLMEESGEDGVPGSSPKHRMVAVVMGAPGTVKEKGVPFSGWRWAGPGHGSL